MSENADIDYDGSEESSWVDEEEWETEIKETKEVLSKKGDKHIETLSLQSLERLVIEKETQAQKRGYVIPKITKSPETTQEKLDVLGFRLDNLIKFIKNKESENLAIDVKDYKVKSLRQQITEQLSKQDWWDNMSPESRENEVRKEMLKTSLSNKDSRPEMLAKALYGEGRSIDDFIEASLKQNQCPYCDLTSERSELIKHMGERHTQQYEKWMDYIGMVIKWKQSPQQGEKVQNPTVPMPYKSDKQEFNKPATLSKDEQDQFPDVSPQQIDRMKRLKRGK